VVCLLCSRFGYFFVFNILALHKFNDVDFVNKSASKFGAGGLHLAKCQLAYMPSCILVIAILPKTQLIELPNYPTIAINMYVKWSND
jgi:hypothetical protein